MSSSVQPTDSVSSTGRKAKPGRRERNAARSLVSSAGGVPASTPKAAVFASGSFDPTPQPGKFPVVFQTGAGEPARDQDYCFDLSTTSAMLCDLPTRFSNHPSFAQFTSDAEIDVVTFRKQLSVSFLLRLAQQTVHSHVNMGLPQGDFAPVASGDVKVFQSVAAIVSQYGEFSSPALGTRFLLRGYEETVSRIVFAASKIMNGSTVSGALARAWLPMSSNDRVTRMIIADCLNVVLSGASLSVQSTVLEEAVFSGSVPDVWEDIKSVLGSAPGEGETDMRDRFDFLFKSYADVAQFTTAFSTSRASSVLAELGLVWTTPSAGHLDWSFSVKAAFSSLADAWSRVNNTYARFFEMSSGLVLRSVASGSPSQLASVSTTDSITVVKTMVALSAPQFSLAACFPPSCVFSGGVSRRVVVSTPLPVAQRATEFCQLDWR